MRDNLVREMEKVSKVYQVTLDKESNLAQSAVAKYYKIFDSTTVNIRTMEALLLRKRGDDN